MRAVNISYHLCVFADRTTSFVYFSLLLTIQILIARYTCNYSVSVGTWSHCKSADVQSSTAEIMDNFHFLYLLQGKRQVRGLRNSLSEIVKPAFHIAFRGFQNKDGVNLYQQQADGSLLLNETVGTALAASGEWRKVDSEEYGTIESLELLYKCQGKYDSGKRPELEMVNGKAIIKRITNLPATHIGFFEMAVRMHFLETL